MEFPKSKLYAPTQAAWPSIETDHLNVDPTKPHLYRRGRADGFEGAPCRVPMCGASPGVPVHIQPLEGWPQ